MINKNNDFFCHLKGVLKQDMVRTKHYDSERIIIILLFLPCLGFSGV